jgi:hypothetical protein
MCSQIASSISYRTLPQTYEALTPVVADRGHTKRLV